MDISGIGSTSITGPVQSEAKEVEQKMKELEQKKAKLEQNLQEEKNPFSKKQSTEYEKIKKMIEKIEKQIEELKAASNNRNSTEVDASSGDNNCDQKKRNSSLACSYDEFIPSKNYFNE
jgi:DNA repair exonuclease SbcCD ATPase subunit